MSPNTAGTPLRSTRRRAARSGRGADLLRIALLPAALLTLTALLWGCSPQESSPLAADTAQVAERRGIPDEAFEPLRLHASSQPVAKRGRVGRLVAARSGGRVEAEWELGDDDNELEVEVTVRVRPRALDRDTRIWVALASPEELTLLLGRHGTRFSIPAELTVEVEGLELPAGMDEDDIDLYWHDEDTDRWMPVPRQSLEIDGDELIGTWLLDHFSRYSLSGGGPG